MGPQTSSTVLCATPVKQMKGSSKEELSQLAAYVVVGIPTCSNGPPLEMRFRVTLRKESVTKVTGGLLMDSVVVSAYRKRNQYQQHVVTADN